MGGYVLCTVVCLYNGAEARGRLGILQTLSISLWDIRLEPCPATAERYSFYHKKDCKCLLTITFSLSLPFVLESLKR